MRIGIITFHFVHNQGAVLQCYALQKYLMDQGHDVKIIDYRPKYHTVRYGEWKNPFRYAFWQVRRKKGKSNRRKIVTTVRSFARCMRLNIKGTDRENAKLFTQFVDKHLYCTKRYTTLKQLKKNPPQMDAYISGSDQLWNPDLLDHKFDPAYFLDFGKPDCMRISYAVSMGKEFSEEECVQLKELCAGLNAVSLRENTPVAIEAIDRDVHICIDPTLLLNTEDYIGIESDVKETEPYIFVYGFETSDAIKEAANQAAKQYDCKVINGSPGRVRLRGENVVNIRNYTPDRFLAFIKNAEFVVTNSFHGTVFSILYKKRFVTVPHTTRGRRMIELLNKLGLNGALWGSPEFSIDNEIDYKSAYSRLSELRRASADYLEKALSGLRGEDIPHSIEEDCGCIDMNLNGKYDDIQVKYGYYRDDEILKKSASGGAASVLAETIIVNNDENAGGGIYGVVYNDEFASAHYQYITCVDDLYLLKGSKYIKAQMRLPDGESVFKSVERELRSGRTIMFTGLGCEVGALKKYLANHDVDDRRLYTVDLICHGPTFAEVQADYVKSLENKYGSRITEYSVRYKKRGWTPPYVHAVFANGKIYDKPFYETELGYAFQTYSRESCYSCKYKGLDHVADLTIGDYWGVKPGTQSYNKNGVSLIFARTEKGKDLLRQIDTTKFIVGDADLNLALDNNRMFEISRVKSPYHESFGNDFKEHGLHYACLHSPGYKAYRKVAWKKMIKRVLKL